MNFHAINPSNEGFSVHKSSEAEMSNDLVSLLERLHPNVFVHSVHEFPHMKLVENHRIFDLQLAFEKITGIFEASQLQINKHFTKYPLWHKIDANPVAKCGFLLFQEQNEDFLKMIEEVTKKKVEGFNQVIFKFDGSERYQLATKLLYDIDSLLLKSLNLNGSNPPFVTSGKVHLDSTVYETIIDLLPASFNANELINHPKLHLLRDIIIDLGMRPRLFFGKTPEFLCIDKSYTVSSEDLAEIVTKVGTFRGDNRGAIEGSLHRISCIRTLTNDIKGLTIRIGRHLNNCAALGLDFLTDPSLSILILGPPGSGKTSIIREAARVLSQANNHVIVVDTSNEICGGGIIPHPAVGLARQMVVPSIEKQHECIIQCLQNHTPDVVIIDEIGRTKEVEAAKTAELRGVRLIASAHGNFRDLMSNAELNGLLGGIISTTVGDEAAKSNNNNKNKVERKGRPAFDVVIELSKENKDEWIIYHPASSIVDSILASKPFNVIKRTRCPKTFELYHEIVQESTLQ